jgi:hypothetical protein
MKRGFADCLLWLFLLSFICLQSFASSNTVRNRAFTGTLVDITCVTNPKRNLGKLRSEHSRKCLLMPVCTESGYALLTDDDEVLRFDIAGNEIAHKLIDKNSRSQSWRVSVDGTLEGDRLSVRHIKLSGHTR